MIDADGLVQGLAFVGGGGLIVAGVFLAAFVGFRLRFRRQAAAARASRLFYYGDGRRRRAFVPFIDWLIDKASILLYAGKGRDVEYRGFLSIYALFLSISIAYTMLFFVLGWMVGGPGELGSFSVFAAMESRLEETFGGESRLLFAGVVIVFSTILVAVLFDSQKSHDFVQGLFKKVFFTTRAYDVFTVVATFAAVYYLISGGTTDPVIPQAWIDDLGLERIGLTDVRSAQVSAAIAAFLAALFVLVTDHRLMGLTWASLASFAFWMNVPIIVIFPFALVISVLVASYWPLAISGVLVPAALFLYFQFLPGDSTAGRLAVAGALSVPFAVAVYQNCRPWYPNWLFSFFLAGTTLVVITFALALNGSVVNEDVAYFVFIFWLLLPLSNAIWDALSWSITWELLVHLREKLEDLSRAPRGWRTQARRFGVFALHLIIDLIAGLVTFFGVLVSVLLIFYWSNAIGQAPEAALDAEASRQLDILGMTRAFLDNPLSGDGLWLGMLFLSTLFPTLLHLVVIVVTAADVFARSGAIQPQLATLLRPTRDGVAAAPAARRALALYIAKLVAFGLVALAVCLTIVSLVAPLEIIRSLVCEFAIFFSGGNATPADCGL